ncbi:MAG: DUF1801 domain-containing protein [Spirosomataceae bacterium]|jgi:uncharacterized protein YdhG (YjbR/CyaY superfamily)
MITKPYALTHEEFFLRAPQIAHKNMRVLQAIIKEVIPEAEEVISYGIPTYRYFGVLCAIGYTKNHVAFYTMNDSGFFEFRSEMEGLDFAKNTIRFRFDDEIPEILIKKILVARIVENQKNTTKKKMK